jgi:iron-sulfur cluster assembly accessory protein
MAIRVNPSRLKTPNKAIFKLTPTAKARIKELMEEHEGDDELMPAHSLVGSIGIRVGTKAGGCNGLRYHMEYIKAVPAGDDVVTWEDITIAVEPKALLAVVGTEMDYVSDPVSLLTIQAYLPSCGLSLYLEILTPPGSVVVENLSVSNINIKNKVVKFAFIRIYLGKDSINDFR